MNEEERQRTMDFILQQQAKFTTDMEKSEARLTRLERTLKLAIRAGLRERREWREHYAALADAQIRTEDIVRGLSAVTQRNSEDIKTLGEVTRRASEAATRASEAAQRNSEDINRLAKILERNASGRNGDDSRTGESES